MDCGLDATGYGREGKPPIVARSAPSMQRSADTPGCGFRCSARSMHGMPRA